MEKVSQLSSYTYEDELGILAFHNLFPDSVNAIQTMATFVGGSAIFASAGRDFTDDQADHNEKYLRR